MPEGAAESEIGTGVVSWQPERNAASEMPRINSHQNRMRVIIALIYAASVSECVCGRASVMGRVNAIVVPRPRPGDRAAMVPW